LHRCASILRSVSRIDGGDPGVGVVGERHLILAVSEITSEGDSKLLSLLDEDGFIVIALEAEINSVMSSAFELVDELLFLCAGDIGGFDDTIVSKFALGLWVFFHPAFQRSYSD